MKSTVRVEVCHEYPTKNLVSGISKGTEDNEAGFARLELTVPPGFMVDAGRPANVYLLVLVLPLTGKGMVNQRQTESY